MFSKYPGWVFSVVIFFMVLLRLVDLDSEPDSRMDGGGQAVPSFGRDHGDLSRLRSSSLEIREKGSEILSEQLDAAKKVL